MSVQHPYPQAIHQGLSQNGYRLDDLFLSRGWRNIAVYGAGKVGQFFCDALAGTDIAIRCIIDMSGQTESPARGAPVIRPEEITEYEKKIDVIVGCLFNYNQAYAIMRQYTKCEMVWALSFFPYYPSPEEFPGVLRNFKRAEEMCRKKAVRLHVISIADSLLYIRNKSLREKSLHECQGERVGAVGNIYSYLEMLEELYADIVPRPGIEYFSEVFNNPGTVEIDGRLCNPDIHSKYVNVTNHMRHTTDQPDEFAHTIHIYGPCSVFGVGVEDRLTMASCLQRQMNCRGGGWRVLNRGVWGGDAGTDCAAILATDFRPGDVCVLFLSEGRSLWYQHTAGETTTFSKWHRAFERPHGEGEVFLDSVHVNHRGMRLSANEIHRQLFDAKNNSAVEQTVGLNRPVVISPRESGGGEAPAAPREESAVAATVEALPDFDRQLAEYRVYLDENRMRTGGAKGAIVMNCNPFTLGHRYLIERAAAEVDGLYIFCLEEEGPGFPFRERIEMLAAGTADLENVKVLRSGKLIISKQTLPEYFSKDGRTGSVVLSPMDALIFAEHIAPALSISVRFSGDEPTCVVTRAYVKQLAEILPARGVEFKIIPRAEHDGKAISASLVRELLRRGDFEGIRPLVPETTFEFLTEKHKGKGQA